MASTNFDDLIKKIESLTVVELAELVHTLEEKFGISAAAATAVGGGAGAGAAAAEEKTAFNVILKSGGASKLNVIKVVREVTTLGLKEAKDLVDGAPKTVKENVKKEEAEEIKKKITEAGGVAEIQ
jgi:large subunit ribosomal protein L7/L12